MLLLKNGLEHFIILTLLKHLERYGEIKMALSDMKVFMDGGKQMMRYTHLKMMGFYDEQADEIINNQDDKRNQLILHIADNFDLINQSSFEVWEMMQKFGFLGATSGSIEVSDEH